MQQKKRYFLLEPIRQYAAEKLGSGRLCRKVHRGYYLGVTQTLNQKLQGAQQNLALELMAVELDNLRAAMDSAQEEGKRRTVGELGFALSLFFEIRGFSEEGLQRLKQDSEALEQLGEMALLAKVKNELGGFYVLLQGDNYRAQNLHNESLQMFQELGDKRGEAESLSLLGRREPYIGTFDRARELFTESLQIQRELEDKPGIAQSLNSLGIIEGAVGAHDKAKQLHTESIEIFREMEDQHNIAGLLNNLGCVASDQEDYDKAKQLHTESLQIRQELGYKAGIMQSLFNLAEIEKIQGVYDRARQLLTKSLQMRRELGNNYNIPFALEALGDVALSQGAYSEARALFTESLQGYRELMGKQGIAESLRRFGELAFAEGKKEQAVPFFLHTARLYEEIGGTGNPSAVEADKALQEIEQHLGIEQFELLKQQAGAMSRDEVIELALARDEA